MLIRLLPAVSLVLLMACGQKQETATTTADSLAIDSVKVAATQTPASDFYFTNDQLFSQFLPFDPSDPAAIQTWFPGIKGDCERFDREDGKPWYTNCAYENESLRIHFDDFYDNASERLYYYDITSEEPKMSFALGVHAGMTRQEFLNAVNVTDPEAFAGTFIWASQSDGQHKIQFVFNNDVLERISFIFNYGDKYPPTIDDYISKWTEVYEVSGEGETEVHVPCGPRSYALEEVDINNGIKYLLTVGMVQDSRSDTVEWVRKTDNGFLVSAFNSFDSGNPYRTRVIFTNEDETLALWGDLNCASSDFSGLVNDQCTGEEPN